MGKIEEIVSKLSSPQVGGQGNMTEGAATGDRSAAGVRGNRKEHTARQKTTQERTAKEYNRGRTSFARPDTAVAVPYGAMNETVDSTVMGDPSASALAKSPRNDISLRELFGTLRRQKWVVIMTVIILMAPAVFFIGRLTPQFAAEALIMIGSPPLEIMDFKSVDRRLAGDSAAIRSEIEVLRSRELAGKVADRLQLNRDPEFNPSLREGEQSPHILMSPLYTLSNWLGSLTEGIKGQESTHPNITQEERRAKERASIVGVLLSRLDVFQKEESRVIAVKFVSQNAKTATLITNTFVDLYVLGQREAKFKAIQRAGKWLNDGVASLREKVETSERAVEKFRQGTGLLAGAKGPTLISQQVSELNTQLVQAQTARIEAETRLQHLKDLIRSGEIHSAPIVLGSDLVQKLRARELETQPNFEKRNLQSAISAEVDNLVKSVENEAAFARAREASLAASLNVLKQRLAEANTEAVQLRTLEREAEANRLMLQTFLSRFKETSSVQDIELQQADAKIISRADVPAHPLPSRKRAIFAVALVGSTFLGLLLALFNEQRKTGFRTSMQVEQAIRLPVLTVVPRLGWFDRFRSPPIVRSIRLPGSAFAESIRGLYARLFLSEGDGPPRTILLASAQPNEGKTTIAICLARMLGLARKKVVVVDADVRRPGIHSALGMPRLPGLVELLAGEVSLEKVIQRDEVSGVDVITAGVAAPHLLHFLAAGRMDTIFDELAGIYDLVIVDSPPLIPVSDARILSAKVDQTVFVLRAMRTKPEVASLALKHVAAAGGRLAGVVLAMVDVNKHEYALFDSDARKYYTQSRI